MRSDHLFSKFFIGNQALAVKGGERSRTLLVACAGLVFAAGLQLTGCTTTDEEAADDEISAAERGSGSGEKIVDYGSEESEPGSGSDETITGDCMGDDDDETDGCGDPENVVNEAPPAPIPALENEIPDPPVVLETANPVVEPAPPGLPGPGNSAGNASKNNGARPQHMAQADVRLECQKIGPGLASGFVRYGCNSMKANDGQHYGIVIGWWRVMRRDGARARARDLNFRESGFDMAFDVEASDAQGGIVMTPGSGEEAPLALSQRR